MVQSGELDQVMARIRSKYKVHTEPLRIGSKTLEILQLSNLDEYIERLVERETLDFHDLPYWAKLWESSFLLAYFLGRQPVVLGQRMLEIGAGIGVVGVYAALCGHQVTITDNNEDALLFARANALLNHCSGVKVMALDWNSSNFSERFDVIFGSEVIYDRPSYPALVRFLRDHLKPEGTIFLAKNSGLQAPKFFVELTRYFKFKQKEFSMGEGDSVTKITLYAVRRKDVDSPGSTK